jgi:hypothetical protein
MIDQRFSMLPGGRLHALYQQRRAARECQRLNDTIVETWETLAAALRPAIDQIIAALQPLAAIAASLDLEQ